MSILHDTKCSCVFATLSLINSKNNNKLIYTVTVTTASVAVHGSFNRIRQVAPTPI